MDLKNWTSSTFWGMTKALHSMRLRNFFRGVHISDSSDQTVLPHSEILTWTEFPCPIVQRCVIRYSQKREDRCFLRCGQKVESVLEPPPSRAIGVQRPSRAVYFTIIVLVHSFIMGCLNFVVIPLSRVESISSPRHRAVTWRC